MMFLLSLGGNKNAPVKTGAGTVQYVFVSFIRTIPSVSEFHRFGSAREFADSIEAPLQSALVKRLAGTSMLRHAAPPVGNRTPPLKHKLNFLFLPGSGN